jgi:hypothetical protein
LQPVRHNHRAPLPSRGLCRLHLIQRQGVTMSIFDDLSDFIGKTHQPRNIDFKGNTKEFFFRELTADEAEDFFGSIDTKDPKKNKGLRNRILAKVVCNKDGDPLMTEKEAGKLPNDLANRLQAAALEVNGLAPTSQEEAKKE